MKRNQIHFFATKSDSEALLRNIESEWQLQFVRAGQFDVPIFDSLHSLLNNVSLGVAMKGDNVQETAYLVVNRNTPVEIRSVPQHNGGTKYTIDQKANPKSIVFRPGGIFAKTAVIAGGVGTISEDSDSLAIFQMFSKEIKQQFKKIKSFYVGKEAGELLDKGWRLTTSVKSPHLYDLQR